VEIGDPLKAAADRYDAVGPKGTGIDGDGVGRGKPPAVHEDGRLATAGPQQRNQVYARSSQVSTSAEQEIAVVIEGTADGHDPMDERVRAFENLGEGGAVQRQVRTSDGRGDVRVRCPARFQSRQLPETEANTDSG